MKGISKTICFVRNVSCSHRCRASITMYAPMLCPINIISQSDCSAEEASEEQSKTEEIKDNLCNIWNSKLNDSASSAAVDDSQERPSKW